MNDISIFDCSCSLFHIMLVEFDLSILTGTESDNCFVDLDLAP